MDNWLAQGEMAEVYQIGRLNKFKKQKNVFNL